MTALLLALLLLAPARALPQDGGPPGEEGEEEMEEGEEEDPGDAGGKDRKSPTVAAKPPLVPVRAAVPGFTAAVCITLRDFRTDPAEQGERDPAEPILLFGHLGEGRTTLALTAEKDDAKHPAAGRRDREAKRLEPAPAVFEVAGVPCLLTEGVYPEAPGAKQLHFHAFVGAAGWSFDLHVSAVSFAGKPAFAREDFEEIVKSLRFGWFRRGHPDLLPEPVLALMDAAARRTPNEVRFLEEQAKARPADGAARLALGEALLASDRPEPAVAACEKAAEILPAKETKEDRFALWMALDGAAAAHLRAGRADKARPHLERARKVADALDLKDLRALTLYGLARCAGEKGEGSAASSLLVEAFALDAALREGAKADPCFRRVKLSKEFRAAVGE